MKTAALLLLLATAFEVPPVIPAAPVEALAPAGATFDLSAMPHWVAYLLPALGFFLFSLFVGALNQVIRQRDAEGVPVSPRLRFVAAVLNAAAANLDKSREQVAKAKTPEVKS